MSSPPPFPSDDEKEIPAKEESEEPESLFAMPDPTDGGDAADEAPSKAMENVDLSAAAEPEPEPKATAVADDDLFAEGSAPAEPAAKAPEPTSPSSTATQDDVQPAAAEAPAASAPVEASAPATAAEPDVTATPEKAAEEYDSFSMSIKVCEPEKIGDGMSAYVSYQVITQTNMPQFKTSNTTVRRRFSDFLALQSRLQEVHLKAGRIIPPAPEKSVVGMAKTKFSKEEQAKSGASQDFIERRRASLERYLNRTASHPVLRKDDIFMEFLQSQQELPKAADTSALSGAGMMRLFKGVGDAFVKMTARKTESDRWFEQRIAQYVNLEEYLKKLHTSIESLVSHRRDLCTSTASFAKSSAILGNTEEHKSLARVLAQLADLEEKIEQLHTQQVENDFMIFGEFIKDYIGLMSPLKACFAQREKSYQAWKTAELNEQKKREQESRLVAAGNTEKAEVCRKEILELQARVEKGEEEFKNISKTMRTEIERFEAQRQKDFKATILSYLEKIMRNQEQLIKYWEGFLPEAKAIA